MDEPKFKAEGSWVMYHNTPLFMCSSLPVTRLSDDSLATKLAELLNESDLDVNLLYRSR